MGLNSWRFKNRGFRGYYKGSGSNMWRKAPVGMLAGGYYNNKRGTYRRPAFGAGKPAGYVTPGQGYHILCGQFILQTETSVGNFDKIIRTLAFNPATIVNGAALVNWGNVKALWQQYKIVKVIVRYMPFRPNDTFAQASFRTVEVAQDKDDVGAPTSRDQLVNYTGHKAINLYEPWYTVYYPPMIASQGSGKIILAGGWINTGGVGAEANQGGLKMYGDGLVNTSGFAYGQLSLEVHIRTRQSA